MCGPADYDALRTSITRLLELSIAGVSVHAIHRAIGFFRGLRRRVPKRSGVSGAAEVSNS